MASVQGSGRPGASRGRSLVAGPGVVLAAWLVVTLISALFAARLPGVVQGGADAVPGSESDRVTRTLERTFGPGSLYQFMVVFHDSTLTTDDDRYSGTVERVSAALHGLPRVRSVETPWNSERAELVGKDWHTAIAVVTPRARTSFEAELFTAELRRAIDTVARPATLEVAVTGAMATLYDLDRRSSSDLLAAERVGLPITAVILLFVFGTPLAAALPIVLAIVAVTLGLAGLFAIHAWMPVSVFAENVVSMIGLGVGVDYALFVLSRYREEVAHDRAPTQAAAAAVGAAGHSVTFSGATVALGFLALLLVRAPFLHSIALGGVFVVVAAVAASMTLLPALLVTLSRWLDWPRRPTRSVASASRATAWSRWAQLVMRRPWPFLTASVLMLLVFIVPVFRLHAWNIGPGDLPIDIETRRGHDWIASQFPAGFEGPVVGVIEARDGTSIWSPEARRAIVDLGRAFAADSSAGFVMGMPQLLERLGTLAFPARTIADLPAAIQPAARRVASDDGRIAVVALATPRQPADPETMRYLRALRARAWPALAAAGLEVHWGGSPGVMADFDGELFGRLPVVATVVVIATFVVLALLFRSLVIPLKATILNTLSVLAAYGFLVHVFQDGIGARRIGLVPPGGLNSFIVLMLFTILFGLSMDYEVFLLSRIREEWRATHDNARAVAVGVGNTGRIITSAALIMISIFASFGFTRLVPTREFGIGLAFAVALDATLIRLVLVPALMVVSGKWNWWWPWGRRS